MVDKIQITWGEILEALELIDHRKEIIYGVPKGGMIATAFLKNASVTYDPNKASLILDDLIDSGATEAKYKERFPTTPFVALINKRDVQFAGKWVVFPWEKDHPSGEENVQSNIIRLLEYIGEDTKREGLIETPERIVRSYEELFSGYSTDPKTLLTHFDAENYGQIIVLKNTEIYSMCEHHMLPFVGKAHVAYIPKDRVIGISKLARLVDIYARRLQIQERIGEQVTAFLINELGAIGAACIIEAEHLCMRMRGVGKQNSIMVTSSLKGIFREASPQGVSARAELMQLITQGT